MRRRVVVLVIVAVLVIGLGLGVRRLHKLSRIGVGYAAEQTCACLFISGRTLESCKHDLDPMAQRLVTVDKGDNEVRAHVPLLAAASARYQPAFGCTLGD